VKNETVYCTEKNGNKSLAAVFVCQQEKVWITESGDFQTDCCAVTRFQWPEPPRPNLSSTWKGKEQYRSSSRRNCFHNLKIKYMNTFYVINCINSSAYLYYRWETTRRTSHMCAWLFFSSHKYSKLNQWTQWTLERLSASQETFGLLTSYAIWYIMHYNSGYIII
jgi:hypothetical protein